MDSLEMQAAREIDHHAMNGDRAYREMNIDLAAAIIRAKVSEPMLKLLRENYVILEALRLSVDWELSPSIKKGIEEVCKRNEEFLEARSITEGRS